MNDYLRITGFVAASLLFSACGGGLLGQRPVFDTTWEDDHGTSFVKLEKTLGDSGFPEGAPVAVGVVPDGLLGVSLRSGKTWSFRHAINGRPVISGDVVAATGAREVFAVSARDGRRLWARPKLGKLRGIGDDGDTTLLNFLPGSMSGSLLLAVNREGEVVQQMETSVVVGRPAVVHGIAFLPWAGQYVSALDIAKGEEQGRVVLRHKVSHAFVSGGRLYFGEVGVTRFDERIGGASARRASFVASPSVELPGKPRWMRDGGHVPARASTAYDSVALYARPGVDGGLDSGMFYGTYYRVVMGFHAKDKSLAWVRLLDDRLIGGSAVRGGLALCDVSGGVRLLDSGAGGDGDVWHLGDKVSACVVHGDGLKLARPKASSPVALSEQIYRALDLKDARLVPIYRVLIHYLAMQSSKEATAHLLDLAQDGRTPLDLMPEIRKGIASRTNGASYMMKALAQGYDFLSDRLRPPPVGPIADALTNMKHTKAAPLLADRLNDPTTPEDDLPRIARALLALGSTRQLESLETFFAMTRTTAHDKSLVSATILVAQALLRVGGDKERALVVDASVDPMTVPEVASELRSLLAAKRPDTKQKK